MQSAGRVTSSCLLSLLLSALMMAEGSPTDRQSDPVAQTSVRNVWDGVYTEAQAERGWLTYREVCGYCHRDNLLGDEGPPLYGVNFTYRWNDLTLDEMFDRIATTMPPPTGALVPTLSPEEYADIISFIFRSNEIPSGTDELPSDPGTLKQIVFTRQPPAE